jgi:hypothetical protein
MGKLKLKEAYHGTRIVGAKDKQVVLGPDSSQEDLAWVRSLGERYADYFEAETGQELLPDTTEEPSSPKKK